jgi:hypothetical protein
MFDIPVCSKCGGERAIATKYRQYSPSGVFPFTVDHVDGKPMEIHSLSHLRQVEKDYGVAFSAFNKNNVNDLDGMKDLPRFNENMRRK